MSLEPVHANKPRELMQSMTVKGNKISNRIKSIIALLIGIFLALICSELILQTINIPQRPASGWLNCNSKNPGECNQLGFRGKEISYSPDDFVVVLLGDSEVYAINHSLQDMPENHLEHYLNKYNINSKVFTIGDLGYGQDQQYLSLKKYFEKYRADLVILMFTARNDIENNIFPVAGRNDSVKPTFWIENNELHGPTERWLEHLSSPLKLLLLWNSFTGQTISAIRKEFWENHILPPPYMPLSNYEGKVDYTWQEQWSQNKDLAFKGIEGENVTMSLSFTPRSQRKKYGINLTRKLFLEIKKITENNGGRFIIIKEEKPWEIEETEDEKVYFLRNKYYVTSIKQYKANLIELFDGFEHYRIPLDMENYSVTQDDQHLNQKSLDKLMNEISEIIRDKKYFKKKSS